MVKAITEVNIPDTIQGIIMARLDRLGEDGKRTVQLASVIGRQFMRRLLERVAGYTDKLEGLLGELKALEIIYEQGLLAEPAYIFKHAVIQDVAYSSLLLQRRKELHHAVGTAIADLYADRLTDHYGELAHHFALAEDGQQALEYSVLAGERAAHDFATTEAKDHFARALKAAERLAPSPQPDVLARLHVKRGAVLMVIAEYEDAVGHYQRALELVRQLGDRQQEVEVLIGLARVYTEYHRPDQALECNKQAWAIARELDHRALQAVCAANRVEVVSSWYGCTPEVKADVEEALRLIKDIKKPKQLARAFVILGGAIQWSAGYDRSLAYLTDAAELALGAHAGFTYGFATFHLGHAHLAKGDYAAALQWYGKMIEYADVAGDNVFMARGPNLLGGVHLELYDLDEAIKLNLEGEEVAHRLFPWPEPRCHALLKTGLAFFERGDYGHADEFFLRAWELLGVDTWAQWRWHIPLLRARGELALARGQHDDAWNFATQSLDMATRCDAPKHIARARRLQGEVLAATARLDEARDHLGASVELAERIHTPREVWMGKRALGKVLMQLGNERAAEAQLAGAAAAIESIAAHVPVERLRQSFLSAEPVLEVYRIVGRRPPAVDVP